MIMKVGYLKRVIKDTRKPVNFYYALTSSTFYPAHIKCLVEERRQKLDVLLLPSKWLIQEFYGSVGEASPVVVFFLSFF